MKKTDTTNIKHPFSFDEFILYVMTITYIFNIFWIQQAYSMKAIMFSGIYLIVALLSIYHKIKFCSFQSTKEYAAVGSLICFVVWIAARNFTSPIPSLGYEFTGSLIQGAWVMFSFSMLGFNDAGNMDKGRINSSGQSRDNSPVSAGFREYILKDFPAAKIMAVILVSMSLFMTFHGLYQKYYLFDKQYETLKESKYFDTKNRTSFGIEFALKEKRITSTFGNSNQLACFFSVTFPFLLAMIFTLKEKTKLKIFLGTTAALIFYALVLTKSRGGMLTTIFCIGFFMLLYYTKKRIAVRLLTTAVLVFALILQIGIFFSVEKLAPPETVRGLKKDAEGKYVYEKDKSKIDFKTYLQRVASMTTVRERLFYILAAKRIIKTSPVIGAGIGSYGIFYPVNKHKQAQESKFAHNTFFQMWAEGGVVAVIVFILFVIFVIRSAVKKIEEAESGRKIFLAAALVSFCGILLNGLIEYSFFFREIMLLLFIFGGILISSENKVSPNETSCTASENENLRNISHGFTVVLFVFILASSFLYFKTIYKPAMSAFYAYCGEVTAEDGSDNEAALEYYNKAVKWDPGMPWHYSGRSHVFFSMGDVQSALKDIDKAIELNPYSASLPANRSSINAMMKNYEQAMKDIDLAILKYPKLGTYYYDKAMLLEQAGRYQEAIEQIMLAAEYSNVDEKTVEYVKHLNELKEAYEK